MPTVLNSEIFFFISSLGFIIIFIVLVILIYYLIKAVRSFTQLMEKIEKNVDTVGDAGRDLIDEMKNSMTFRLLFRPGKRK